MNVSGMYFQQHLLIFSHLECYICLHHCQVIFVNFHVTKNIQNLWICSHTLTFYLRICYYPRKKVRDLEAELEAEARRVREAVANQRKAERFYKELQTQTEEERKQLAELQSVNDQLTIRLKTYKRQIEEAVSFFVSFLF